MLRKITRPMWFWPIALLASAFSFPAMLVGRRYLPELPSADRVAWEPGSIFHNLKNVTTEMYRADPMWWSKGSCFVIAVLTIVVIFT